MSRLVAVTVWSVCLSLGLAGLAAAQEPPPLEPPSLEPPRTVAAQEPRTEASPKPAAPASSRTRSGQQPPARGAADASDPGCHGARRSAFSGLSPSSRGADSTGRTPRSRHRSTPSAPVGIHNRPVTCPLPRFADGRAALSYVARRHTGAAGDFRTEDSCERDRSRTPPTGGRLPAAGSDPPDDRADRRAPSSDRDAVGRPAAPRSMNGRSPR